MKTSARCASPRAHAGPNMTPLVDVVVVLLIFLMLAGSFGSAERSTRIGTGTGPVDRQPPGRGADPGLQLDVFVSDGGGTGTFAARLGGDPHPLRDAAALRAELERRRVEYAATGTSPESVQVVIRPAAGTAWAPVVAAHEAALGARFPKTAFAVAP